MIDPNVDPIGLAQTGPDQCALQTNSVEEITSQFGCIWMYLLEKNIDQWEYLKYHAAIYLLFLFLIILLDFQTLLLSPTGTSTGTSTGPPVL